MGLKARNEIFAARSSAIRRALNSAQFQCLQQNAWNGLPAHSGRHSRADRSTGTGRVGVVAPVIGRALHQQRHGTLAHVTSAAYRSRLENGCAAVRAVADCYDTFLSTSNTLGVTLFNEQQIEETHHNAGGIAQTEIVGHRSRFYVATVAFRTLCLSCAK